MNKYHEILSKILTKGTKILLKGEKVKFELNV